MGHLFILLLPTNIALFEVFAFVDVSIASETKESPERMVVM